MSSIPHDVMLWGQRCADVKELWGGTVVTRPTRHVLPTPLPAMLVGIVDVLSECDAVYFIDR
jgi:hypothetical protein